MARFAPVAPPPLLQDLEKTGWQSKCHLLLTHDVVEHPHSYRAFFNPGYPNRITDPHTKDWTVILDNSVVELGKPASTEMTKEAYDIVQPDFVCLPDVLGDRLETIRLTRDSIPEWQSLGMENFMVIPQGKDASEFISCAAEMHLLFGEDIEGIGIPRHLTELCGTRIGITGGIVASYPLLYTHLLGFSDDLLDDIACARLPGVDSIDSAVPVRAGIQDFNLDGHALYRMEIPGREDFWERAYSGDYDEEDLKASKFWCKAFQSWIKDPQLQD